MRLSYDHDAIFLLLSDPAQLDQRISSFLKNNLDVLFIHKKYLFRLLAGALFNIDVL